MNHLQKHLFICTGNTCRSQMAEALARYYFPHYQYSSAGLAAITGAPTSTHAITLLAAQDIAWQGHSKPLTPAMVANAHHIWVMTKAHKQDLLKQLSVWSKQAQSPIIPSAINCLATQDIVDPYGQDLATYASCLKLIDKALRLHIA